MTDKPVMPELTQDTYTYYATISGDYNFSTASAVIASGEDEDKLIAYVQDLMGQWGYRQDGGIEKHRYQVGPFNLHSKRIPFFGTKSFIGHVAVNISQSVKVKQL